jgi:hypothetical protein
VIRVADRVWKEWRDVEGWGWIELVFTSALSEDDALAAVEAAVQRTFRTRLRQFHLGFRPRAVWIGFKRSTAQSLPAARTPTWRVRRGGFFSLGARVTVGGSNFSASYNGCIRLR